jgi:hypothetical protein
MGLVEHYGNASLMVDVSNVVLTPTELFLLSSVPAADVMASTWHRSPNWYSDGRRLNDPTDRTKIVLTHEKQDQWHNRAFELRMYEDDARADGSVICAVVEINNDQQEEGVDLPIDSFVLIFWNKMRLRVSNQGYGLGAVPGTHRYDGMSRVL